MLLDIFIQILFILHGFPSPVSAQHQRYKCVPLKQRLNVKLPPKCFSLGLKVWCHLKVWKWESWRRPLCKPAPRPPSGLPPSPCLPRSDLYLFNQRTFSPRASDCVTKPAATYGEQVKLSGGKRWPTGDLVSILGPTGDWSRRPAAARPYIGGATPNLHLPKLKSPLTNILNLTIQMSHRHHMNQQEIDLRGCWCCTLLCRGKKNYWFVFLCVFCDILVLLYLLFTNQDINETQLKCFYTISKVGPCNIQLNCKTNFALLLCKLRNCSNKNLWNQKVNINCHVWTRIKQDMWSIPRYERIYQINHVSTMNKTDACWKRFVLMSWDDEGVTEAWISLVRFPVWVGEPD